MKVKKSCLRKNYKNRMPFLVCILLPKIKQKNY